MHVIDEDYFDCNLGYPDIITAKWTRVHKFTSFNCISYKLYIKSDQIVLDIMITKLGDCDMHWLIELPVNDNLYDNNHNWNVKQLNGGHHLLPLDVWVHPLLLHIGPGQVEVRIRLVVALQCPLTCPKCLEIQRHWAKGSQQKIDICFHLRHSPSRISPLSWQVWWGRGSAGPEYEPPLAGTAKHWIIIIIIIIIIIMNTSPLLRNCKAFNNYYDDTCM